MDLLVLLKSERTVFEDKVTADISEEENATTVTKDEMIVGHRQEGQDQNGPTGSAASLKQKEQLQLQ